MKNIHKTIKVLAGQVVNAETSFVQSSFVGKRHKVEGCVEELYGENFDSGETVCRRWTRTSSGQSSVS